MRKKTLFIKKIGRLDPMQLILINAISMMATYKGNKILISETPNYPRFLKEV